MGGTKSKTNKRCFASFYMTIVSSRAPAKDLLNIKSQTDSSHSFRMTKITKQMLHFFLYERETRKCLSKLNMTIRTTIAHTLIHVIQQGRSGYAYDILKASP